jgi:hypothetical protein
MTMASEGIPLTERAQAFLDDEDWCAAVKQLIDRANLRMHIEIKATDPEALAKSFGETMSKLGKKNDAD